MQLPRRNVGFSNPVADRAVPGGELFDQLVSQTAADQYRVRLFVISRLRSFLAPQIRVKVTHSL